MKAVILFLALVLSASADWKNDLAPANPGSHPKLGATTLAYQLSWKGTINAGNLTFRFGQPAPGKSFPVRVSGGSGGFASTLFPYKVDLTSKLDSNSLRPLHFRGIEIEGDEITITESSYAISMVRSTERNRPDKKQPERKWSTTFRFRPTFDAMSAILHVRSHPLKKGDALRYALVPFNTPYLATVHVAGREPHLGRPAIKLTVSMQKIDPQTLALLPYKKLKSATLWITDDTDRIPLELRSKVFIGDVRMTLTGMKRL